MPTTSSADAAIEAAKELTAALANPHPRSPFAPIGNAQIQALKQLADIFVRATTIPKNEVIQLPKLQKVEGSNPTTDYFRSPSLLNMPTPTPPTAPVSPAATRTSPRLVTRRSPRVVTLIAPRITGVLGPIQRIPHEAPTSPLPLQDMEHIPIRDAAPPVCQPAPRVAPRKSTHLFTRLPPRVNIPVSTPPLFYHNNYPLHIPTPKSSTPAVTNKVGRGFEPRRRTINAPIQAPLNTTSPSSYTPYPHPNLIPHDEAFRPSALGDHISGGNWIDPDDISDTVP